MPLPRVRIDDEITDWRQLISDLLEILEKIRRFKKRYDWLAFQTILNDNNSDFTGRNQGITKAEFTTAVTRGQQIVDALDTVTGGGTSTLGADLHKVKL